MSIMQKRHFKFRFDFIKYAINWNCTMLNNDISRSYYVKHGFVMNIQAHRVQILQNFLVIL